MTLTTVEAAKALGIGKRQLLYLIQRGQLPATKNRWGIYELSAAKVAAFAKLPRPCGRPRQVG